MKTGIWHIQELFAKIPNPKKILILGKKVQMVPNMPDVSLLFANKTLCYKHISSI